MTLKRGRYWCLARIGCKEARTSGPSRSTPGRYAFPPVGPHPVEDACVPMGQLDDTRMWAAVPF
jgi:hypothetical protein